ncbi:MAG: discoidin domain-containing protein, partial [Planctomycetota bacterium]
MGHRIRGLLLGVLLIGLLAPIIEVHGGEGAPAKNLALRGKVFASSRWRGWPAEGAVDGHRFSTGRGKYWCGSQDESTWGWGIDFSEPRTVGRIYQVMGSDPLIRKYAPIDYVWQWSADGRDWRDVPGTTVTEETRLFRILTFEKTVEARFFRIRITEASDGAPALREVEMFADRDADVRPAPWFYAVEIGASGQVPGKCKPFLSMARRCPGWEDVQAHVVHVTNFNESILEASPRPLCAFIGGSTHDWCERNPDDFRGLEEVLKKGNLPLWGSCGGGQILSILAAYGTTSPWICPHCEWNRPERYRKTEKPFIYDHIRCKGKPKCGEYPCQWEKGFFPIVPSFPDPAFRFLPS